jgi:two-component system, OmpR family, response regulator
VAIASERNSKVNVPDQRAGLRVLIVEGNDDCAASMAMLLRLFGHDVRISRNGPEALDAAWADKPDVVLLEIGLPGMNGFEVAKQLSGIRTAKTPLIVAVTGFGQESDRRRSAEVGIDLHLVKPVDPKDLKAILRRFQKEVATSAAKVNGRTGTVQS